MIVLKIIGITALVVGVAVLILIGVFISSLKPGDVP